MVLELERTTEYGQPTDTKLRPSNGYRTEALHNLVNGTVTIEPDTLPKVIGRKRLNGKLSPYLPIGCRGRKLSAGERQLWRKNPSGSEVYHGQVNGIVKSEQI